MRYIEWDGEILETRKERQLRERSLRSFKRKSLIGTTGLMTALSVTSLLLSGFSNGTEAMLVASASVGSISVSAADHFPSWYNGLNNELNNIITQESAIVQQMNRQQMTNITPSELDSLKHGVQQLTKLSDSANQIFLVIKQAAMTDKTRYSEVLLEPGNSQSYIASFARVAAIGQQALGEAQGLIINVQSYVETGQAFLNQVQKEYQVEQALLEASVLQSVYGNSVINAVYGDVTNFVYGGTFNPLANQPMNPAVSQTTTLSNPVTTTSPPTTNTIADQKQRSTVIQSVYGTVYESTNNSSTGTLLPNTNS